MATKWLLGCGTFTNAHQSCFHLQYFVRCYTDGQLHGGCIWVGIFGHGTHHILCGWSFAMVHSIQRATAEQERKLLSFAMQWVRGMLRLDDPVRICQALASWVKPNCIANLGIVILFCVFQAGHLECSHQHWKLEDLSLNFPSWSQSCMDEETAWN